LNAMVVDNESSIQKWNAGAKFGNFQN
jgi:hypothetical protein